VIGAAFNQPYLETALIWGYQMNCKEGYCPKIKDGFVYDILREEDMNGAIDCIIQTFVNGEPMTKAMEITKQEFQYFAEIFCIKAVQDGVSIVVKDEKSNKVVEASFVKIL
jgi:hypothetical protein